MKYLILFFEFFKVGLFTFGGGYAMIPLIKEVVLNHNMLLEEEFYNFLGICESTPGPIAINMATFIGYSYGSFFGSFCATLGVVLPSFIIILLIAKFLQSLIKSQYFKAFINGVKPVIIALIVVTSITLVIKNISIIEPHSFSIVLENIYIYIVLILVLFITKLLKKKIPTPLFILIGATLGIVINILI